MLRREWKGPIAGREMKRMAHARGLAILAAAALLGACQGDALDPGIDITGPVVTLAPQTVSVAVSPERQLQFGAALQVAVSANTGTGTSGVATIGATALVLNPQGAIVGVLPVGSRTFAQPQPGTVTEVFRLEPAPPFLDLTALPDTLTYEVHGWAVSGGGACVAAVTEAGQRLPCAELDGQRVAQGQRGAAINVVVIAPHGVLRSISPARTVELGGGLDVTVAANTGVGVNGVAEMGATAIVRNPRGTAVAVVPLRPAGAAQPGPLRFPQSRSGPVAEPFRLEPDPAHVDLNALPDTLVYEVHAWAVSASGVCVAAVAETSQQLQCRLLEGQRVARDTAAAPVAVTVLPPHAVQLQAVVPARIEAGDVMTFTVGAQTRAELGGIQQVGVAARVRTAAGDTATVVLAAAADPTRPEAVETTFRLTFQELGQRLLGRLQVPAAADQALTLEPSAFAIHTTGACVAAVENVPQQLPCAVINGGRAAAGVAGAPVTVTPVEGRTVPLPAGVAQVGDLLVHAPSNRLFLSNLGGNTVEVLNVADPAGGFSPNAVRVGSRPWGMALNAARNELVVANSGGTNFSLVPLATMQEQRVPIPRVTLYQLEFDETGILLQHFSYADRPRFLAQDANGRILYSALSTQAAPEGTIRALERHPATGAWESRILFPEGLLVNTPPIENRAVVASENSVAIANVDSMHLVMREDALGRRFATGEVVIFDHPPGAPNEVRRSPPLPFVTPEERAAAMAFLRGEFGSDIAIYEGHAWNFPESVAVQDPTFVAASSDRRWVAFGEGAATQIGRIVLWGVQNSTLSRVEEIRDITNNTSDLLSGVALNQDGTRGAARGAQGVYFFDRNLRLQGTGGSALAGGAGIDFRPGDNLRPEEQFVFVGTGRNSIQVLEPLHFQVVREVPIRANVVGPLQAAPCAPGAPADCMVTVYAVTAQGVVMVHIPR